MRDLNANVEGLTEAEKIIKQSCTVSLFFRNLGMYKVSAVWKKPSSLRQGCATNAYWKSVPNLSINFKDMYRTSCLGDCVLIGGAAAHNRSLLNIRYRANRWVPPLFASISMSETCVRSYVDPITVVMQNKFGANLHQVPYQEFDWQSLSILTLSTT